MLETLIHGMRENGYEARALSIERLKDIETDILKLRSTGELDGRIDAILEDSYSFKLPERPFEIKSIIVVASPCPQTRVVFNRGDKKVPLLIPPTYAEYSVDPAGIEKQLNELLGGGPHAARVKSLPEKILAVRSGLGVYGRNNIIYVQGMGSFVLLSVYYSDMECGKENWHDMSVMKACANCRLCLNQCPTGAIPEDRYLVKAERCITYFNEFTESPDFPQWLDPRGHNCIIGCLHCQKCCPQNKRFLDNVVDAAQFDARETEMLLSGSPLESLPGETADRVRALKLEYYYHLLARNLKVLMQ